MPRNNNASAASRNNRGGGQRANNNNNRASTTNRDRSRAPAQDADDALLDQMMDAAAAVAEQVEAAKALELKKRNASEKLVDCIPRDTFSQSLPEIEQVVDQAIMTLASQVMGKIHPKHKSSFSLLLNDLNRQMEFHAKQETKEYAMTRMPIVLCGVAVEEIRDFPPNGRMTATSAVMHVVTGFENYGPPTNDAAAWVIKGMLYGSPRVGNFEEAIECVEKGLELKKAENLDDKAFRVFDWWEDSLWSVEEVESALKEWKRVVANTENETAVEIVCPVCLEDALRPQVFDSCSHIVCETCAWTLLGADMEKGSENRVGSRCPSCRSVVTQFSDARHLLSHYNRRLKKNADDYQAWAHFADWELPTSEVEMCPSHRTETTSIISAMFSFIYMTCTASAKKHIPVIEYTSTETEIVTGQELFDRVRSMVSRSKGEKTAFAYEASIGEQLARDRYVNLSKPVFRPVHVWEQMVRLRPDDNVAKIQLARFLLHDLPSQNSETTRLRNLDRVQELVQEALTAEARLESPRIRSPNMYAEYARLNESWRLLAEVLYRRTVAVSEKEKGRATAPPLKAMVDGREYSALECSMKSLQDVPKSLLSSDRTKISLGTAFFGALVADRVVDWVGDIGFLEWYITTARTNLLQNLKGQVRNKDAARAVNALPKVHFLLQFFISKSPNDRKHVWIQTPEMWLRVYEVSRFLPQGDDQAIVIPSAAPLGSGLDCSIGPKCIVYGDIFIQSMTDQDQALSDHQFVTKREIVQRFEHQQSALMRGLFGDEVAEGFGFKISGPHPRLMGTG